MTTPATAPSPCVTQPRSEQVEQEVARQVEQDEPELLPEEVVRDEKAENWR